MSRTVRNAPTDDDDDDNGQDNGGMIPANRNDDNSLSSFGRGCNQGGRVWTNLKPTSAKLAAALVKASGKADYTADDLPDGRMDVTYLMVQEVTLESVQTGELVTLPRVVIMDKAGKSCQFVSIGVFGSIKILTEIFGAGPWEPGLPCKLVRSKTTKGFNIYRLELDSSKPMPGLK